MLWKKNYVEAYKEAVTEAHTTSSELLGKTRVAESIQAAKNERSKISKEV